jgi:hypothetical protein
VVAHDKGVKKLKNVDMSKFQIQRQSSLCTEISHILKLVLLSQIDIIDIIDIEFCNQILLQILKTSSKCKIIKFSQNNRR